MTEYPRETTVFSDPLAPMPATTTRKIRTPEQRAQDARDRRKLLRDGVRVANPMGERFTGALCACGAVVVLDGRSWIHLGSGTVECGQRGGEK